MSDLDNAINSINASAVKAENTATFLDDMSTFDDQSSVTNPNNGQTVASISKQVKDRTDELFTAAESDINQAVSDAAQSATDAQDAADSIGRYQGLWPDTGGIADKGDTYQTQVSGTPTGQYFTALQNTTVDPLGDDVNWRSVVSDKSLKKVTPYKSNNVQEMLSDSIEGVNLEVGDRVTTGSTTWLITSSSKGWELDASDGRYALPLNGVFLQDLGADPNNGNDASDAFDLALSNYDVSLKRRFTIVGAGGDYNISRKIPLTLNCSRFKLNGGGATLTATADMDDMISWPHISDVELEDITFKLAPGVSITNSIVDGGKDAGSTDKGLRTKLRNLRAFEIAGSPRFIQLNQEWEFKLENIRSDHDVSGQTGVNIELFSCVNGQLKTPEVGYSAVGVKFSKSDNVSYQCEGIDLISPVTTFAAIGLKGDNITSLKVLGGVLDFCLTRAWEFTNGTDVSFFGTWFANRSDSATSGTLGISQPAFSKIKLTGCEFVNNQANAWNALSLNSAKCKATDNTSKGAMNTGFTLDDLETRGNDFIPNSNTRAIIDTQTAPSGSGNATKKVMNSGESAFSASKLLHRHEYNAPNINAANTWAMSTYAGNFSDQLYVAWEKSYVEQFRFDMVLGNFELSRNGKGIKFKSPDGLTTKLLTIDNSGNPVWS